MTSSREFRFDPLRRQWVVIATDRAGRPNEFRSLAFQPTRAEACPFCPGNEHETPAEIMALRRPDSGADRPGWTLRVVSNRFPALALDASAVAPPPRPYRALPGVGRHEVVIETDEHQRHPAEFEAAAFAAVIRTWRERARSLAAEAGVRHVIVFKNSGPRAGASLSHPHTQIIALDERAPALELELAAAAEHRAATGRCLACDLVRAEEAAGTRVVGAEGGFVSYTPYASRFAAETWITARSCPPPFAALSDEQLEPFARLFQSALGRIRTALGDPSFNCVLHAALPGLDGYHWRLEITPRLAQVGGFELGTGVFINALAPEAAAERLRRAGRE